MTAVTLLDQVVSGGGQRRRRPGEVRIDERLDRLRRGSDAAAVPETAHRAQHEIDRAEFASGQGEQVGVARGGQRVPGHHDDGERGREGLADQAALQRFGVAAGEHRPLQAAARQHPHGRQGEVAAPAEHRARCDTHGDSERLDGGNIRRTVPAALGQGSALARATSRYQNALCLGRRSWVARSTSTRPNLGPYPHAHSKLSSNDQA